MTSYMESFYDGHPILKVFREVRMPVLKADIWRYWTLFREGGVYCDIKSAMTVPLRDMIRSNSSELISFEGLQWKDLLFPGRYANPGIFLAAPPDSIKANLEHPDELILNWFLFFEKENPILAEVIDLIVRHADFYRNRVFENMSMAGNHFTGVIAFTQAVWIWMQKTGRCPGQNRAESTIQGMASGSSVAWTTGSPRITAPRKTSLLSNDKLCILEVM